MRKLSAVLILIVVYLPLAFAAMTLTSIRPWVLDRAFYERIVGDKRLYEATLTEEMPDWFSNTMFTSLEQLPLKALSVALREVVTPAYLRTQAQSIISQVFDYIDGREATLALSVDVAPIKAALAGEGKTAFASALAAALPACAVGQAPIASGGRLTRCIAADGSVAAAAKQIAAALPALLEASPDRIVVESQGYLRMSWYDYAIFLGSGIHGLLDAAIIIVIFTALIAGVMGAYLGGDDLRARLKWFSSSLFAPASLFVFSGAILTSSLIVNSISKGMAVVRWNGTQYSEAYKEAVTAVVIPVIQQIGSGLLATGGVVFLVALGVLIWSLVTPANEQRLPKFVQVPAQNPQ